MRLRIQGKKLWQSLIILPVLTLLLAVLSACAGAPAAEAPAAPEEPAQPVEPGEGLPVTYGQDSRTEVFQHTDPKLKEMAASIAIFVHRDRVKISGNSVTLDGYTLNEMSEMGWLVGGVHAPVCAGELFTSQVAPGFCTGFLVKDDILVTAGHCLQKTPCSDTSIVFGFQMESGDSLAKVTKENIFYCAEVIAQATSSPENRSPDYAVIRLDRLPERAGLDYATGDGLKAEDRVAVIGYPSGLPMKIASDATVMSNVTSDSFFIANLDTFGSNSGSPVINVATYQVEGILVSGMPDYVLSGDDLCVEVNRCPESGGINCAGENVTKMAMVAGQIPESTTKASNGLNCFPNTLLVIGIAALHGKRRYRGISSLSRF